MESAINAVVAILGIILATTAFGPLYRAVKHETVIKVSRGLPPLEPFTQKLTGKRLKY